MNRKILIDLVKKHSWLRFTFDGEVIAYSTLKAAEKAGKVRGNFNLALKRPYFPKHCEVKKMTAMAEGRVVAVSKVPPDGVGEGFATIVLHKPIRKDIEVVLVRVEDVTCMFYEEAAVVDSDALLGDLSERIAENRSNGTETKIIDPIQGFEFNKEATNG